MLSPANIQYSFVICKASHSILHYRPSLYSQLTPVVITICFSCDHNLLQLWSQFAPVVITICSSCDHNLLQLSSQSDSVVITICSGCHHNLLRLSSQSDSVVITIAFDTLQPLPHWCRNKPKAAVMGWSRGNLRRGQIFPDCNSSVHLVWGRHQPLLIENTGDFLVCWQQNA